MTQVILTASPDSDNLALREMYRASADARLVAELAPGVLLVEFTDGFNALAETWQTAPPIFVRHVCPVQAAVPLAGNADDLAALCRAVETGFLAQIKPDQAFSVQTRIVAGQLPYKPYDLNTALAALIHERSGAPLDVRAPVQVLSLVVGSEAGLIRAFLGLSPAAHNLSDWAGGVRRFARQEAQISRSEFKLLEALEVFRIRLQPGGFALDLGAAPGGWTRILRERGLYVTAIDPAALDERLRGDPRVRYRRLTAEAYLADDPDRFDVIVNDMRMDARDSARLMAAYARLLRPGGCALMTLKLPEHDREQAIEGAVSLLRRACHIAGARQLFHNRSEITVYLQPR